jgi:tyrosyl-tRNA synthetase
MHPKEAKLALAENIVGQFHGADVAVSARAQFEQIFSQKQIPDDIQEITITEGSTGLLDLLLRADAVPTKNEARRLLKQNAITFEGSVVTDENWSLRKGVLKIGKRRFLKLA